MEANFNDYCAAQSASQKHSQEIKNTRIGGLGGSDASMLLRIGNSGLSAITNTDNKRLAIMLGMIEQDNWQGNIYTNAGHIFEDYAAEIFSDCKTIADDEENKEHTIEREKYMYAELAKNFKTFAHADFVINGNKVVECKYVQKTTDKVAEEYAAQLQWYYMLGAKKVVLLHGIGSAEPFEIIDTEFLEIERDEMMIAALLNGIKVLDDAIQNGWRPTIAEKATIEQVPAQVLSAMKKLDIARKTAAQAKADEEDAKSIVFEYMQGLGYSEISGLIDEDGISHKCTLAKPRTTKTFNVKMLQEKIKNIYDTEIANELISLINDSYETKVGTMIFTYK